MRGDTLFRVNSLWTCAGVWHLSSSLGCYLFCPTSQMHDMLPLPMLLLLQGHNPDLGLGHYESSKQGAVPKGNLSLEVTLIRTGHPS